MSIGLRRVRRLLGMLRQRLRFLSCVWKLEAGELRAAEPDASVPLGWRVNGWVKRGILLGFRIGTMTEMGGETLRFIDKHTFPGAEVCRGGWRARGAGWCERCGLELMWLRVLR